MTCRAAEGTVSAMAEIVYPRSSATVRTLFRALDLKIRIEGAEHIPRTGGAVLVSNHISYLDFIFAGLAALPAKRLVRFMAKKEVFDHRISGPLMRGMHHIPVDRAPGAAAFGAALKSLKGGEIVGVFAEATISRSFTVKEIKNGAVRMAAAAEGADDPDGPLGHPAAVDQGPAEKLLQRHVPITILIGEPMHPGAATTYDAVTRRPARADGRMLDQAQRSYPEIPRGRLVAAPPPRRHRPHAGGGRRDGRSRGEGQGGPAHAVGTGRGYERRSGYPGPATKQARR